MTGLLPEADLAATSRRSRAAGRSTTTAPRSIRFENGALGTVTASQISHGRENDLFIEIDGTKASLEWHQEEPNKMIVRRNGQPHKIYTRDGGPYLGARGRRRRRASRAATRKAFLEAFANVYTAAYDDMVEAGRRARSSRR